MAGHHSRFMVGFLIILNLVINLPDALLLPTLNSILSYHLGFKLLDSYMELRVAVMFLYTFLGNGLVQLVHSMLFKMFLIFACLLLHVLSL